MAECCYAASILSCGGILSVRILAAAVNPHGSVRYEIQDMLEMSKWPWSLWVGINIVLVCIILDIWLRLTEAYPKEPK